MEIFANAQSELDYAGSGQVGDLGMLRIVSVRGSEKLAEVQLLRYRDRGYFASAQWSEAVAFTTQRDTIDLRNEPIATLVFAAESRRRHNHRIDRPTQALVCAIEYFDHRGKRNST